MERTGDPRPTHQAPRDWAPLSESCLDWGCSPDWTKCCTWFSRTWKRVMSAVSGSMSPRSCGGVGVVFKSDFFCCSGIVTILRLWLPCFNNVCNALKSGTRKYLPVSALAGCGQSLPPGCNRPGRTGIWHQAGDPQHGG